MQKRLLLVARYYSIEPLGILYLAGLARDAGWECKVLLIHGSDFEPLYRTVGEWNPQFVGFQIWTGYHIAAFAACDRIRAAGVPVIIGGPHATYFHDECARHADFVVKGSGFGLLEKILQGGIQKGIHFDKEGRADSFPLPDRGVVYGAYPELGRSSIKSLFTSVGCPFTCTYCYAPSFNQMHGGFSLTLRPVDSVITEALETLEKWPATKMFYMQDDIFGYDKRWLEEFALRWKKEVGIGFHCQIRLELTRHEAGDRRLDLFAEAGCSGITLAIESGNAFLRDHVLFRHMDDELIVEGCRKILNRGLTLRTEQILAVPFSDTATDLATLDLNNRIAPTMAWTSILAPYGGTDMGTIAKNFGFYCGNNDDLAESFFDRSVLRHTKHGPQDIERIVRKMGAGPKSRTLLSLHARPMTMSGGASGWVGDVCPVGSDKTIDLIYFMSDSENERYCEDTVRLQRLFNWLAKVPDAQVLGLLLTGIPQSEWSWSAIGKTTRTHLLYRLGKDRVEALVDSLAAEMRLTPEELPEPVHENPFYFVFFPEGGRLAQRALGAGVFSKPTPQLLDELSTIARRHLFHFGLYKIESGRDPIAA